MVQSINREQQMHRIPSLQFYNRPNYMGVQAIVDNVFWGYYLYLPIPHIYEGVKYTIGVHFIPDGQWVFTNHPESAEKILQQLFYYYMMEALTKEETIPS